MTQVRDIAYPWVQGDVLDLGHEPKYFSELLKIAQYWVVATQTCTLINGSCIRAELVPCQIEKSGSGNPQHLDGENPRILLLRSLENDKILNQVDRHWTDKESLRQAVKYCSLNDDELRKLVLWLARSYMRLVMPETFIACAKVPLLEPLIKFCKKHNEAIIGIYLSAYIERDGVEQLIPWRELEGTEEHFYVEPFIVLNGCVGGDTAEEQYRKLLPRELLADYASPEVKVLATTIHIPDNISYSRILKSHRLDYKDYLSQVGDLA